jgi:hypothetical protein
VPESFCFVLVSNIDIFFFIRDSRRAEIGILLCSLSITNGTRLLSGSIKMRAFISAAYYAGLFTRVIVLRAFYSPFTTAPVAFCHLLFLVFFNLPTDYVEAFN